MMSSLRRISSRFQPRRRETGEVVRPLRCMFVITSMPVGGAETLLVNLMRKMDQNLVRPEVACLKELGPLGTEIGEEFPIHANLIRSKYDFGVVLMLRSLMIERKIDAVVTVGAGDKMFWGRLAAMSAGIPVIASALHSTGWPDGIGKVNRTLTAWTDAFIGVADSHGEFLRSFEKLPAEKVHVIRNGIDCNRFIPDPTAKSWLQSEIGVGTDTNLVGIIAALRDEKNHELLVRVADQIRETHRESHFVIVGDGPTKKKIQTLAAKLGVQDRVHLMGTRLDTPRIVAGLDVFALCSLNEASPVSILEALACEVPVVATNVGSVSESVVEGQTGLLVESEDVTGFATAVSRLLSNATERQSMGAAGRALVLQSGSLESMTRGYENLLTDLYDQAVTVSGGRLREAVPAN